MVSLGKLNIICYYLLVEANLIEIKGLISTSINQIKMLVDKIFQCFLSSILILLQQYNIHTPHKNINRPFDYVQMMQELIQILVQFFIYSDDQFKQP